MAFKDWFTPSSPLQLALERGFKAGGDLQEEINRLGEFTVRSKSDAKAICKVLSKVVEPGSKVGGEGAFTAMLRLFQEVDGRKCPAFEVMGGQGVDILLRVVEEYLNEPAGRFANEILYILKILAMYGTEEGTDALIAVARNPSRPDDYLWNPILQSYTGNHPCREKLFNALADPLPEGFLGVSLLDAANTALLEGIEMRHPFDSAAGIRRLEGWLSDEDEENFSYAISATAALPYLSNPDSLFPLAFDHPKPEVQLEAAWAAGKLGRESGIQWLSRACLEVNLSARAREYLEELDRGDAVPEAADDTDFQVKAEFAKWLTHPNELGRPPDDLEILDHRVLKWPPKREPIPGWLVRYGVDDSLGMDGMDVGVGMVGSITFCLFTYQLEQRPPTDGYAIHCYWEMTGKELIEEVDVEEDSREYDPLLRGCPVQGLEETRILAVAELSAELGYPQRLVALAKAKRQGQPGWIVVDGERSRWYAAEEMPVNLWEKTVLMVHVGRGLLGFDDEPDRKAYLSQRRNECPPEQIIEAYEALLEKARSERRQGKKLLGDSSPLGAGYEKYVQARVTVRKESPSVVACEIFETLMELADRVEPKDRADCFDVFSALGSVFDAYVDALIDLERQGQVNNLIERLRPNWEHNLGYRKLGTGAFKSGNFALAEDFFLKLKESGKGWCRWEEMAWLAEIWSKNGKSAEAKAVLIDALRGILELSRGATGSDRKLYEGEFQNHRQAYLRLFPNQGEEELGRQGIGVSTMG